MGKHKLSNQKLIFGFLKVHIAIEGKKKLILLFKSIKNSRSKIQLNFSAPHKERHEASIDDW